MLKFGVYTVVYTVQCTYIHIIMDWQQLQYNTLSYWYFILWYLSCYNIVPFKYILIDKI
jgi:hypothetical protein